MRVAITRVVVLVGLANACLAPTRDFESVDV